MISMLTLPYMMMLLLGLGVFVPNNLVRLGAIILAPVAALISVWILPLDYALSISWLAQISLEIEMNIIARFMITIFAIVALAGGIYGYKYASDAEIYISYAYVAAGMICMLAADFLLLIIAWELLAILGVFILWFSRGKQASAATMRYALWHFLGGAIFLSGIGVHLWESQMDTSLQALSLSRLGGKMIFVGVLVNTGLFPFTSWVVDAYSNATLTGSVFLSSITTKTAVIIMAKLFTGTDFLIYPAIITILVSCIYAIREDDIRKLLAWAILIQVGFMIVAISAGGNTSAIAAQAGVHILYKSTLFMAAGMVIHYTGVHQLSKLGGLMHSMPIVFGFALVAALTSMALPLTAGFMAKTALINAISDAHGYLQWSWLVFLSAAAILPTGLWFMRWVFGGKQSCDISTSITVTSKWAMGITAGLCIILALPPLWQPLLGMSNMADYYEFKEVIHALQLICATLGGGWLLMYLVRPQTNYTLGVDWLWREGYVWLKLSFGARLPSISKEYEESLTNVRVALDSFYSWIASPLSIFNRPQPVSQQALNIVAFLGFFSVMWLIFA